MKLTDSSEKNFNEEQSIKKAIEDAVGGSLPKEFSNLQAVKHLIDYYNSVINSIPAHVFWLNKSNKILGCNDSLAKYMGLTSGKEVVHKDFKQMLIEVALNKKIADEATIRDVMEKQADELDKLNQTIMRTGKSRITEEYAQQPDKVDIFLTQKSPLYTSQGKVAGIVGISLNITESKRSEEQRLNLILEASHTGTWTWNFADESFILDHMNHKGPYRLAKSFEEMISSVHPSDQQNVRQALEKARNEKTNLEIEYRFKWIDGNQRYFSMRGKVVENKQGVPHSMVGICWDITERKHQEESRQKQQVTMAQVSRQNAMGELASTLAHELNQPLAAISNYIDGCIIRLQRGQTQPEELLKAMELASLQSARAGEIIHRIKNFMRKGELIFSTVNINNIINDVITTLQFELTSNHVTLQLKLAEELPTLRLDEIQIGQVVLNLLRNAIEAMQNAHTAEPVILVRTLQQGNEVHIDVIDNGPGCPKEIANQLFTAYFTTKKNGMGIGLAICRSIVEAHNGQLEVMPNENGAWFRFTLPIGSQPAKAARQVSLAYPEL